VGGGEDVAIDVAGIAQVPQLEARKRNF
jgi:hypothetical protein